MKIQKVVYIFYVNPRLWQKFGVLIRLFSELKVYVITKQYQYLMPSCFGAELLTTTNYEILTTTRTYNQTL